MLRNCWLKWFENRMQYRRLAGRSMSRRGRTAAQNRPVPVRVGEVLETRTLLTTYFVDTTSDDADDAAGVSDGLISLREAMVAASTNAAFGDAPAGMASGDTIRFAAGLNGAIINITQGALPTITEDLSIFGTIGNAQSINGAGLIVNAAGAGNTTTFAINSININLEPNGAGLEINAVNDGVADVTIFNSRITNSATQGINFSADTGGVVDLTLSNVQVLSNGDVVQSEGILGEIGLAGAESLTMPGSFATAILDVNNTLVANNFLEGFKLTVQDGGLVTTPNGIRNSAFGGNSVGNQRSALKFTATGAGTSLQADISGTTADNSKGHGFEFQSQNGADIDISVTNSQAFAATADAMNFMVDAATATIDVSGFLGSNAKDDGVEFRMTNAATVNVNSFNNVTVNNVVNTGLKIGTLSGSTLSAFNSTGVTANNNGGRGALLTTLGSTSNFSFTNLTTNNNQIRGVEVGVNESGTSTKVFNNVTATANRQAHAMGIGVGNTSMLNLTANGGTISSAGSLVPSNSIFAPIVTGSTANLTFNGIALNGSTSSGIVLDAQNGSTATLNVSNSNSMGNRLVGIAAFARTGSNVTGSFNNVNVSNSGQQQAANGMRLDVLGAGATGNFTFNGVTADGSTGQGISLLYNGGATGSVNQFDNISARNTGGDGVNVNVRGVNTTLNAFNANTVNVTGAGLGVTQTSDGLDIMVVGPGAMADFDIANLTANGAGGRGVKFQAENTATVGLNVNGFSASNNDLEGILLDVGTVVAGTQLTPGSAFSNGSASSNGQGFMQVRSGIRANVRGAGTSADIAFDNVFANSSTADGFHLIGDSGATLTVDVRNGTSALGNARNGINFDGDGPATTVALTSTVGGNNFTGNVQDGVNVTLTNGVTANDITVQGSASLNQGDGVQVTANDGSGVTINNLQVTGVGSSLDGNMGNGLIMDLNMVAGITALDLSSLSVSDNDLDQINVTLSNMVLTDISLDDVMAIGPGALVGNGDGIELTLNNTQVTNSLSLSNIIATDNGEDGAQFNFNNGSSIPASSAIDIGTFESNGQHGVNLNVNSSTVELSLTNSDADMGSIASLSGNGGNGLNIELNNANLTLGGVDSHNIVNNTGSGVNVQAAVPSTFISNNTFTNNVIQDNGGFGFRGIFNGGLFDISIGENGAGNVFAANTGAAIAIDMVQNTVGQLRIVDNEIFGTNNNPANTVFNGEGIFIRQLGTVNPAQATNTLTNLSGPPGAPGLLIQNNLIGVDGMGMIDGNASFGITFQSEEESDITGLHIFDNDISNNGNDGISFRRFDEVTVSDFRIEANNIDNNNGDGIEITGENDDNTRMDVIIGPDAPTAAQLTTDSFTTPLPAAIPRGNDITNNNGDGIRLQVNADAALNVNIRDNFIVNNNDDGIGLSEVVLDPSDNRQVSGVWVQNIIADNGDRGVESSAVTFGTVRGGDGVIVMDIRNGVTPAQGIFARANTIGAVLDQFSQVVPGQDGNGSTGIEINGGGASTWVNTQVLRNGRERIANRAVGHGFDIQAVSKDVVIDNSLIRENFQDGIEINANGLSFINTDLSRNRVQLNDGRGLDILTQDRADTRTTVRNGSTLVFSNGAPTAVRNVINSNEEEGVYYVTTASTTQNQNDFASTALAQNGSVTNSFSTASLVIDNATISNNGSTNVGNLVASAGVVVRVGTQDAPNVLSSGPHFATTGTFTAAGHPTGFFNGGAFLQFTNNILQGNFGDDVFIHSYRSTGDPGTIGGTWSDTQFAPTNTAQGDPLARLDVVWGTATNGNANVFDSLDLNNSLRRGTPDGQAGAFYENADGTFKSRLGNATPGGPFSNTSASRRRNAQRAPARTYPGGFMLAPTVSPDGGIFQYPGLGDSTFRVLAGGNTSVASNLASTGFFLDDNPVGGDFSPIESPFEASGVGFTGNQGSFELPFGWGTF